MCLSLSASRACYHRHLNANRIDLFLVLPLSTQHWVPAHTVCAPSTYIFSYVHCGACVCVRLGLSASHCCLITFVVTENKFLNYQETLGREIKNKLGRIFKLLFNLSVCSYWYILHRCKLTILFLLREVRLLHQHRHNPLVLDYLV